MHTVWDWTTLALFSALAVLFLHRSFAVTVAGDRTVLYLPAVAGCVAANLLGNDRHGAAALAVLVLTGAYAAAVLKPWRRR